MGGGLVCRFSGYSRPVRPAWQVALALVAGSLAMGGVLVGPRTEVGRDRVVDAAGIIDAFSTPTVALKARNPEHVAIVYREDRPRLSARLSWSADSGATWHSRSLPLPVGDDRAYLPDAAFAPDGTLFVVYVNLSGRGNVPTNLWVAHFSDEGRVLAGPVRVVSDRAFQPRLAIGPRGRLYVTWLHLDAPGGAAPAQATDWIAAASSADAGATWSAPTRVTPVGSGLVGAGVPATEGPGHLVVAYERFPMASGPLGSRNGGTGSRAQPYDLMLARSTDSGASFHSPPVPVARSVLPGQRFSLFFPAFPSLAARPPEELYLAAQTGRPSPGGVALWRSPNEGASWSEAVVVAASGRATPALPAVAVAPNGRIDIAYLDGRNDPSGVYTDAYLASSADGGRHFTEHRLSADSFDPSIGPDLGSGQPDVGSHLGIADTDTATVAAWADTSLGTLTTGRQDIVAARVRHAGTGVQRTLWGAAALVALSTALLAAIQTRRRVVVTVPARSRYAGTHGCQPGPGDRPRG